MIFTGFNHSFSSIRLYLFYLGKLVVQLLYYYYYEISIFLLN